MLGEGRDWCHQHLLGTCTPRQPLHQHPAGTYLGFVVATAVEAMAATCWWWCPNNMCWVVAAVGAATVGVVCSGIVGTTAAAAVGPRFLGSSWGIVGSWGCRSTDLGLECSLGLVVVE